jgi:type II secretory pathway pseudopilin PulG
MKKQPGFTIIEIAVVIVIITGLIGGLLIPVKEYYRQTRIELTQQRLEEIKEALLTFAVINGYLPCPAENTDGKEADRTTTTNEYICDTYDDSDGFLPWDTLGIGEYYDGWGNPFRYRVDGYFSNSNGIYKDTPSVGSTKDQLEVKDRQDNLLNVPNDPLFNSNIVAIIFSYGQNAQPEQGTESTTKNNYIQDVYLEIDYQILFDDMLIWVPKYILINRLAAAGKWPPK